METQSLTREQLNAVPKEVLVTLYMQLSENMSTVMGQNEALLKKVDQLQESIAVLIQQRYGKKSEKSTQIEGQLSLDLPELDIFNEAEKLTESSMPEEPSYEEVIIRRKKKAGKKEADLSGFPADIEEHILSEEELATLFPAGYRRLPDEVHREVDYIPVQFHVREIHTAVYAGKDREGRQTVVKAERPKSLLKNSIISPSLAAAVINAKYINSVPLNRFSQEIRTFGLNLSRQTMAGWMIRVAEMYFSLLYRRLHEEILQSRLIHCDETPFKIIHDVNEDGTARGPTAKSYMWVYHTPGGEGRHPVCLYDYRPTRKTSNPETFLKGYRGILVTDGYQSYHTMEKRHSGELKVAGCWAHAKRKFADICKAKGADAKGTIALEADRRIEAIYHMDNMKKDASAKERLEHRQASVRPLVEAFFEWAKEMYSQTDVSSETGKALGYCLNQQRYLELFLTDPVIPMTNNDAERSIRKFVVGRKNWVIIDSKNGAEASAILYSIAETARANRLRPFYYFQYVLEEMVKHMEDKDLKFIEDLLPWSDKLPEHIHNK